MKEIVIKKNGHTIYKRVPDDYVEGEKDIPSRPMTTTSCNQMALDISKERYEEIFGKKDTTSH